MSLTTTGDKNGTAGVDEDKAKNTKSGLSSLQQKLSQFANKENGTDIGNGDHPKPVSDTKNDTEVGGKDNNNANEESDETKESEVRQEEEKMEEESTSPEEKNGDTLKTDTKKELEDNENEEASPNRQKKKQGNDILLF